MNTYEINNIKPFVDTTNHLIAIAFNVTAKDDTGDTAEASWHKVYSTPLSDLSTYDDTGLKTLCQSVATEKDMYAALDKVLANRKLPFTESDPLGSRPPIVLSEPEERLKMFNTVNDSIKDVIADKSVLAMGYVEREAAANTYKAAGYAGDPTEWITRFADNVGMSYQAAADLILSQAVKMRKDLFDLENLRMDKYLVMRAATIGDARAVYQRILQDRNAIVGGM